ncbi:hypothetical protein [Clostridium thermarum]|uniref:hypothetical protein n=1 Tax=Clostridium thermarum TaxID=1716543 RepID=UPI0013D8765D|nr:hypothetical protein [Clostridium thermarum]
MKLKGSTNEEKNKSCNTSRTIFCSKPFTTYAESVTDKKNELNKVNEAVNNIKEKIEDV